MESWISDLGLQKSVADSRPAVLPQYSLYAAMENNRPYFGRQLSAFQSLPVRYAVMADFARYALRGKAAVRILEVGSWAGASAITFGTVIQELGISDGKIVCIDQWEKYFVAEDSSLHYMNMNAAVFTGEIQRLFQHNVKACGLEKMVQVKKASSREVLPELKGSAFDLVYIDGSHKKDDVLYDLQQAKRLVQNGGVICGDDLELMKDQIDPDAHNVALVKNVDFVVDPRTGVSYHPGVTDAIAAEFDSVWQEHGFWCVLRSADQWCVPDFRVSNLEIPIHLQHAVEIPYGLFNGYECFQLGEAFIAYPMSDRHWFQNRIVTSSIEELVLLLDAIDHIDKVDAARILESRSGFNIVGYKGKSWVVDQSVGYVNFHNPEQLRHLISSGGVSEAETLEEARALADRMRMDKANAPHLVESRDGFNIVSHKGKHWVVGQSIGNVDFRDEEQLRELTACGRILKMETIGEARAAIDRIRMEEVSAPQFVESRGGFNILIYKGRNWIVDQAAGTVDFRDQELLNRLVAIGMLHEVETISAATEAIDRIVKAKANLAPSKPDSPLN
jgi:predicted O-methyltransferase YrrM